MKKFLVIAAIVVMSTQSFAWRISNTSRDFSKVSFNTEQQMTEDNQKRLIRAQPPEKMTDSLERKQINQRTKLWNDPYKVSYLYIFSRGGGCIGYFTVKGKVSSVNSMVTNPEQVLAVTQRVAGGGHANTTNGTENVVVSAPAEDGSYGTNGDGIFAFGTNGMYMETNMEYLLVDQPIKLSTVKLGEVHR